MADLSVHTPPTAAPGTGARPRVSRMHHVSVPVRDLDEACAFWSMVFGAERLPGSRPRFAALRLADVTVGLAEQDGGWTARAAEDPHCGWPVAPDAMGPVQERPRPVGGAPGPNWTPPGGGGVK